MAISKKSKLLAMALCLTLLVSAMPLMALASPTVTIDNVTASAPVEGLITITVKYTATDVDQVTLLGTAGPETAPTATEANIAYIDQQEATKTIQINNEAVTGFSFVVDAEKFTADTPYIHIKMGGTSINEAQSANPILLYETTTKFKVYGYVNVPVAVGATVTLAEGKTATTDQDGKFEITGVEPGAYSLAISAKSALTRTIPVTVADADVEVSVSTNKITLMFGDVDGNGKIELEDLVAIKGAYNKTTIDSGYNAFYDLDKNGKIELEDLVTIKGNYNKSTTNYQSWVK